MKKRSLFFFLMLALLSGSAWAQSEYHSYSNINHTYGSSSTLYTGNSDNDPARLLDNSLSTKYCAVFNNNTWPGYLSVNFESNDFIIPSKYVIYTGDDTQSNPGRNPKSWEIKASVDGTNWDNIHTVTNANLPATNKTKVEFEISGVTKAYKYFRFYINSIVSASTFQLQDFYFIATVQGGGDTPSGDETCEDFESVTAVNSASTAGNMPDGWDYIYTGSNTGYSPKVYNGSNYKPSEPLASVIGSNRLMMIAGTSSTYGENTYVILPNYNSVITGISFNAWRESANNGTLYFGYITNASDASTFHQLYQLTTVAYGNATASNASFSYDNLSIPSGARLAFRWNHTSSWYSAFIDNVCVTTAAGTAPASLPYTENFENGQNGWEFGNGTYTNHWTIGTATSVSSSHSLYVTNGTANEYSTGSSSYVYAYRELNFTEAGDYLVSFKWKANGESGCYDAMYAALVPQGTACPPSSNITGSTNSLPSGYINASNASTAFLWGQSSWQTSTKNVSIPSAGIYTLVFYWKNDNSGGSNPPAAVDDIDIQADLPPITEIYTVADWEAFCTAVNSGHNYSGKTVTLMNDITTAVTTMAGVTTGESTYNYAFKGTFDGQGHTLTVNLTSGTLSGSWYYTAPFRVIDGATIKNLKTTGTVTQNSGKGAAGLAGYTTGTCTITNCVSNVTINSLTDGDGTHGGFFSEIRGTTTMNNCAFTGSITGSSTRYCGGFVGWKSGTATFNNCVFAPTAITFDADHSGDNSANFSRNGGTFNNCYYTQTCGSVVQGKLMHSITGALGITVANAGTATSYTPETSTIVGYGTGIKFNNILYAGSGDNVSLTLSGSAAGYVADHGTLVENGSNYTLTMEAYNTIIIYKPLTKIIEAVGNENWEAEKGGYYLIASPLAAAIAPTDVDGMITDELGTNVDPTTSTYDLYSFNQAAALEWQNYRASDFNLVNGTGYLYASKGGTTLTFSGAPYSGDTKTVTLHKTEAATGLDFPDWNLVGNPFALDDAYITKSFYTLENSDTYTLNTAGTAIHPMQGLLVVADEDGETMTFSTEAPAVNNSKLNMNVSNERSVVDQAIISFTEGQELPKLQFRNGSTKVYMPKDGKEYAIVSTEAMGTMPVNFKAENDGTYTLSFTAEEVSFSYLHLIDNLTGEDVDLLAGASTGSATYTFEAKTTDYESRFKLVFATGNNANDDAFAFYSNGSFVINNEGNATLQVIDMNGRILKSESINGCANVNVKAAAGVYMLRLVNGNDVKVQKVVVR